MNVSHVKCQADPHAGSFEVDAYCYRTEVHNPHDFPIRVIWFEAYMYWNDMWCGGNVKNKILREEDFCAWYSDGVELDHAWIPPGATAVCDPNWHMSCEAAFSRTKWCFMAVDERGNSYFDEAEVEQATCTLIKYSAP